MNELGALLLLAFAFSVALSPLSIYLARRFGVIDRPGPRKVHLKAVPRLGWVSVWGGALLAIFSGRMMGIHLPLDRDALAILAMTGAMGLLGFLDDLFDLRARTKFIWQIVIASLFVSLGYSFDLFNMPGFPMQHLGVLILPFTVLWIVAVVNGFNFIDGVDGLAASVSAVTLAGLALFGYVVGNGEVDPTWIALLGAVLGFLLFNRAPAKIFLGDAGAYAIGMFVAASLVVLDARTPYHPGLTPLQLRAKQFSVVVATLLVGYPMLEAALSTLRRAVKRFLMGRSMEWSEKEHLHHRLLKLGLRPAVICWVSVMVEAMAVAAALLLVDKEDARAVLTLLPVVFLLAFVMPPLGFFDFLRPALVRHQRPHFRIAHLYTELQRVKMELAVDSRGVLALLEETAREFGVVHYRVVILPDARGRGALDAAQPTPNPSEAGFEDRVRLPDRRGGAFWTFKPQAEEGEIDVERRMLFAAFMRNALEALLRLERAKGAPVPKGECLEPTRASGYHALRRGERVIESEV